VLVLVEQQLEVLQEQQLEQEQLELHQAAESWPRSAMSSTSKVTASSSRSSWPRVWADTGFFFLSSLVVEPVRSGAAHAAGAARTGRERPDDREGPGAPPRRRAAQPPPQPVLVLVEQQLEVLQEQQLEQEQLELHQPARSWPGSEMSSISKVVVSRARSSSFRFTEFTSSPGMRSPPCGDGSR